MPFSREGGIQLELCYMKNKTTDRQKLAIKRFYRL